MLVPVKDGGKLLERCLAGVADQDVTDEVEVIVVDSGSRDGSVEVAKACGARVYEIAPAEFGHGRTRNLAAGLARGDTLVFTSQDAVAADDGWLRRITAPLVDSRVAGVYGRQLPHEDATPPERFFLDFLYGPRQREQRIGDVAELTYERTLFSNVNSAMRRSTWADHPFRDDLIMSEDQEWSRRMLLAGFSIVYEPEAVVSHSHRYSVTAAFRRFFDSGLSAKRSYVAGAVSRTALRGAALRYAGGELSWLWRSGHRRWIPYAGVYELSKFAGLQLGLRHEWLPISLKRRLSAQPAYWTQQRVPGDHLRVLLVSANFRPSVGGIERFVEILAEGLAERGHAVTVATCTPGPAENGRAVRVVRIPATDVMRERLNVPYPVPPPRVCVRMLSELLQEADVVHVQDAIYATSVASLVLARHVGVPSILTQHVGFVPQQRMLLDAGQHAAIRTLGHSSRLAAAVAAYNPSVAEWAQRTWGLDDVRLLPSGVLERATSPAERAAVRAELQLPTDAFVALFTGRDVPKKRLDVFLSSGDAAYHLVAVTDRTRAAPNGAMLVPFTTPERFGRLLAAADAFVLPSEGEGFPLALQEALLAGIPSVVTPGPGYEFYVDEDDVIFVPPDPDAIRAALVRLASDDSFRQRLAERARAAGARSFGVQAFVAGYEHLYRAVLDGPALAHTSPRR